jgi:heat shock protein HslJ
LACASLMVLALVAPTNALASGLAGTRWKAYRILGRSVPRGFKADIEFHRRTVQGHSWCNSFAGRYNVSPGFRLRFGSLRTTAIGCGGIRHPPDFYRALLSTRTYAQRGARLILESAQGKVLARLKR